MCERPNTVKDSTPIAFSTLCISSYQHKTMYRVARFAASRFPRLASSKPPSLACVPYRRGVSTVAPDSLWPYWANRADRLYPNNLSKQNQNVRRQSTLAGMPEEVVELSKAAEDRGDKLFVDDDGFVWKARMQSYPKCVSSQTNPCVPFNLGRRNVWARVEWEEIQSSLQCMVSAIRSSDAYTKDHPDRVAWLDEHGFVWEQE